MRVEFREVREKGDLLNLADLLDCCIRESVIAIGERWPSDKRDVAPKLRAA